MFTGAPTNIDVNLNIRSMGPISEKDMVGILMGLNPLSFDLGATARLMLCDWISERSI